MKKLITRIFRDRNAERDTENHQPEQQGLRRTSSVPKFRTEQEMKMHIAKNLGAIEPGLRLCDDRGYNGVEVPCRVTSWGRQGSIDILAQDQTGAFVVLECKLKYGDAMAFGQVLGYMSWIKSWLREEHWDHHAVRAIIVCKRANPLLKNLLLEYPDFDVAVYEYEASIDLDTQP